MGIFRNKRKNKGYLEGLLFAQESSLGNDYQNLDFTHWVDSKEVLDDFAAGMRDFHKHQNRIKEWCKSDDIQKHVTQNADNWEIKVTVDDTREESESVNA